VKRLLLPQLLQLSLVHEEKDPRLTFEEKAENNLLVSAAPQAGQAGVLSDADDLTRVSKVCPH
jgi:hypothetical protein